MMLAKKPSTSIRMTPQVFKQYKESIAANEPETFALLGGSLADDPFLITDFYFLPPITDAKGGYVASGSFVYPDHMMLNYIIDRVLVRNGRYMIGLWHSHPGGFNVPSEQDLTYCSAILDNDDSPGQRWRHFLAPITTFDIGGRDSITGWVLDKGETAFRPIEAIDIPAADNVDGGADECESPTKQRWRPGALRLSLALDSELLASIALAEVRLESATAELTYIEKYHARRKLAEVRCKLKCHYA